jgi:hypothetical protein
MGVSKSSERMAAIRRGLEFIYEIASDPQHFADHGSDLLNCFYFIGTTSEDADLRRAALKMGRERARAWRREHRRLPGKADSELVSDWIHGCYAADRLGLRDPELKEQLRVAAARFPPADFLWFDPLIEPPPADIPEECECGADNPRGRKACRSCKRRLRMMSRYWIYLDALTRSYTGERYGIHMGSSFASVIKWLPHMRPYQTVMNDGDDPEAYEKTYAITHIVYTLNDYSLYQLSPRWLPQEYEFLKATLKQAIAEEDAETLGEIMDSLRSFGLTSRHPLMRAGIEFLLATQNEDGSWGDLETEDFYQRYHPTWTAIDGLREYRWRGRRLSFPKLLPLVKEWAGRAAQ